MENKEITKENKKSNRQNKIINLFNNYLSRGVFIKLLYDENIFDIEKAQETKNYQDLHREIVLNKYNYQKINKLYKFYKAILICFSLLSLIAFALSIYILVQPWFKVGAGISKEHLAFYVSILIIFLLAEIMPFLAFNLIDYACAFANYHDAYLALKDKITFRTLDLDLEISCIDNLSLSPKRRSQKFKEKGKFVNLDTLNINFLNSKFYTFLYKRAFWLKFMSYVVDILWIIIPVAIITVPFF